VKTIKFRPSSHSDNYTVIATYKDSKTAEKAHEKLRKFVENLPEDAPVDWGPDEACCSLDGNTVRFDVDTAGDTNDVECILQSEAPTALQVTADYQEVDVSLQVKKSVTIESLPLILSKTEAAAFAHMVRLCGRPAEEMHGDTKILRWTYRGESIYCEDDNTLDVGFWLELNKHKNWQVDC
jgi:hypothetical protein